MFSIKKDSFFDFATFMLQKHYLCFSIFFSLNAFGVQEAFKVREFRHYREIKFAESKIFIDKKSLNVIYSKKNEIIKIEKRLNGKSYTFQKSDSNKDHFLVMLSYENRKIKRIGYLPRDFQTQYQSEICEPKSVFSNLTERILSPDLIGKIKELKITDLFDKNSCAALTPERFEEFKKVLIGTLVYKQSSLQKCLDSKVARDIFIQDTALLNNANEVFSKYLDLIDNLQNSKMKLKCGMPKESSNKVASFSQNPLEIAINVIDEKFNLKIDNIKSVMNHELLHLGMQQFKTAKDSRCMDEGFVTLFENVCKYSFDTTLAKPGPSSQIADACLEGKEPAIQALSLSKSSEVKKGECPGCAAVALANADNQTQSKQVTEVLAPTANAASKPVFEEIPSSTIQLAATAPVMTSSGMPLSTFEGDGEFHAVIADSNFSSSVQQLGQSLASSMTNANQLLTTALGNTAKVAAVAVVGSSAVAATNGGSNSTGSSQYAPMTSSEIFMNRYYPDSKEVQTAMSNPKLDAMTYDQKESYYRSLGGKTSGQSTSVQLASDAGSGRAAETKSVNAASGVAYLKSDKAGSVAQVATGAPASRTVASLPTQSEIKPSNDGEGEEPAKKAHAENTGIAAAQPAPVANSNIKLDNAILQRLTAFSKVNEPAYTRVTERFSDKTFRQQLDARKIRIVGENNKPLWVSSIQPQRCFRDNKTTKVLEVVACK